MSDDTSHGGFGHCSLPMCSWDESGARIRTAAQMLRRTRSSISREITQNGLLPPALWSGADVVILNVKINIITHVNFGHCISADFYVYFWSNTFDLKKKY